MLKRALLVLAIFIVLIVPAFACEHYPGQVVDEELEMIHYIAPQSGVAGSADLCCPLCGEIVKHDIFDPLPAEAEHPASSDAEIPLVSAPVAPQEIVQEQVSQESSFQPEVPARPVQLAQPETPAKSSSSPETARSEDPAPQPGSSVAVSVADTGRSSPAAAPAAEPPKAQEVTANVSPETAGIGGTGGAVTGTGSSGGGGAARQAGRAKISGGGDEANVPTEMPQTFPFRRVKMKPKPDIRAEAAGVLLWPVYGTPFQNIYND